MCTSFSFSQNIQQNNNCVWFKRVFSANMPFSHFTLETLLGQSVSGSVCQWNSPLSKTRRLTRSRIAIGGKNSKIGPVTVSHLSQVSISIFGRYPVRQVWSAGYPYSPLVCIYPSFAGGQNKAKPQPNNTKKTFAQIHAIKHIWQCLQSIQFVLQSSCWENVNLLKNNSDFPIQTKNNKL